MLFHGYSRTGKFTVSAKGNVLEKHAMLESMSGDLAAFAAGTVLIKTREKAQMTLQQRDQPDAPILVKVEDRDCGAFRLVSERILFPPERAFCGSALFVAGSDGAGGFTFQHFSFFAAGLPPRVRTAELGNVQILSFGIEEEFQQWRWPGDTRPFLLPRSVRVAAKTDKGQIEIVNSTLPARRNNLRPSKA
jgi:hypothetical protein